MTPIPILLNWLGLYNTLTTFLQQDKILPPTANECPEIDSKQSDVEVPVMLEIWVIQSTPSLSALPGSLCPSVGAPDRVLSMGQIELNCELMLI